MWNFPTGVFGSQSQALKPIMTPSLHLLLLAMISRWTHTTPQRDVILQLLNSAAESELAAVKLLRGRNVTNVPLLKHKSAVIVFNSILNPPEKRSTHRVSPRCHEANSIVSIVCGVNKIAWAHVDRGMNVLE
uniref:Uncharacterized protein n=1 Tax=Oncorhynchus mykiss TaxID=8022 RepID=A0A8C7SZ65_ONCMY